MGASKRLAELSLQALNDKNLKISEEYKKNKIFNSKIWKCS